MIYDYYDYIVIGSGVGGSLSASVLNKKHSVLLLEKDSNLGGCSGTFKRKGHYFNAGATTFNGLGKNMPVGKVLQKAGVELKGIKEVDPAITVIDNGKVIRRSKDLSIFLKDLNKHYPHSSHEKFFKKVLEINRIFYKKEDFFFSFDSLLHSVESMLSFLPMFPLRKELMTPAIEYLNKYYKDLDKGFVNFLDNQVLIVAQGKLKDVNFLTLALALGYTFYDNYYVYGGLGSLFDDVLKDVEYKTKSEVISIERVEDLFLVKTKKEQFRAKRVISNVPSVDNKFLQLENKKTPPSSQGACVLYLVLKSKREFNHHYQFIEKENFPYSFSNSIFVSFSDKEDEKMYKNGCYSITISTHTYTSFWKEISKEDYKDRKEALKKSIIQSFCKNLEIDEETIVFADLGTPITFQRFIGRESVGGVPTIMKNINLDFPNPTTKVKDLYQIGDTIFPGQGWPGVSIGVKNLLKVLDE